MSILADFGLTSNEEKIFVTLSRESGLGVAELAKKTGLNRPYIYYALERLREKGYVSDVIEDGNRKFRAVEIETILSLEKNKLGELNKYMTSLKVAAPENNALVEVISGKNAIKTIIKKLLADVERGDEILYFGLDEKFMEQTEPLYVKKGVEIFKKKHIRERVIAAKGSITLGYATMTTYKEMDPTVFEKCAKIIYGNTVIELIYSNPLRAIIIKNESVANAARKQFEIFWKIAEPLPKKTR